MGDAAVVRICEVERNIAQRGSRMRLIIVTGIETANIAISMDAGPRFEKTNAHAAELLFAHRDRGIRIFFQRTSVIAISYFSMIGDEYVAPLF